jgi:hypothetical protein
MNSAATVALLLGLLGSPAFAVTLSTTSVETPYAGVTLTRYRASSPSTDIWVAAIDLCEPGIRLESTRAPSATQSTGSWAASWDLQVAINADFYRTGPVRVYGDAIGSGVRWPISQTGLDSSYSSEWYYQDFGWFAFGPDRVDWTHTGWVKDNSSVFGGSLTGFAPTTKAPTPASDLIALVSGFPALVVEGTQVTCSSPTASSCFPDRSDMRDRHPRSALGISADGETLFMLVADGRTSSSAGLYGAELADVMYQIGAWQAINLDGGGSSQLWLADRGYANNVSGNNSGSGTRSVANHLGLYAGGSERAAHCASAPPCEVLGPAGGILDNDGACFYPFGDLEYWRTESDGHAGSLRWTRAVRSSTPDNWAWWRIHLEEEGDYLVEWFADSDFGQYNQTHYTVVADGTSTDIRVDQGGLDGWQSLGTYHFAAGGDQYVFIGDDAPSSPPSDRQLVADAIRLTRVGPWCGDAACDSTEDCAICPEDCTGPEEIFDNGLDDDCDGLTDERPPDTGSDGGESADGGETGGEGTSGDEGEGDGSVEPGTDGAADSGVNNTGDDSLIEDSGAALEGKGVRLEAPCGASRGLGALLALLPLGLWARQRPSRRGKFPG